MTKVVALPEELKAAKPPACVACDVNDRAAVVIKLDRPTIRGFRGALPIGYRAECGFYPTGAVIRLVLTFYDRPEEPYTVDTFLNVGQPYDLALLRKLQNQDSIDIHFLDPRNDHALGKQINHAERIRAELRDLVDQAITHNCQLPRLDFPTAKAAMMKDRPM